MQGSLQGVSRAEGTHVGQSSPGKSWGRAARPEGTGRPLLLQERGHLPGSVAVDRGTYCGSVRLLAAEPPSPPEIFRDYSQIVCPYVLLLAPFHQKPAGGRAM